jgi:hypothetical protein
VGKQAPETVANEATLGSREPAAMGGPPRSHKQLKKNANLGPTKQAEGPSPHLQTQVGQALLSSPLQGGAGAACMQLFIISSRAKY